MLNLSNRREQQQQRMEKNEKKKKKKLLDLWESIKINNFVNDRVSRRRKNGEGVKWHFKRNNG